MANLRLEKDQDIEKSSLYAQELDYLNRSEVYKFQEETFLPSSSVGEYVKSDDNGVIEGLIDGEVYTARELKDLEEKPMEYLWMINPSEKVRYREEENIFLVEFENLTSQLSKYESGTRDQKIIERYKEEFEASELGKEELENIKDGEMPEDVPEDPNPALDIAKVGGSISLPVYLAAETGSAEILLAGLAASWTYSMYTVNSSVSKFNHRQGVREAAKEELDRRKKIGERNKLMEEYDDARVAMSFSGSELEFDFEEEFLKKYEVSETEFLDFFEYKDFKDIKEVKYIGSDFESGFNQIMSELRGDMGNSEMIRDYRIDDIDIEARNRGETTVYEAVVEGARRIGTEFVELESPLVEIEAEILETEVGESLEDIISARSTEENMGRKTEMEAEK